MRKFKIKNRRKRKYTKRNTKSTLLKNAPIAIKTVTPVTTTISPVIPAKAGIRNSHQNTKTKVLLTYILILIISLYSITVNPYLAFAYPYHEILIMVTQIAIFIYDNLLFQMNVLNKIIITIQNITNENNKTMYKIIFTIIYTIDFTNSWLINQIISYFQTTGHTIIYYWEKLINIISAKITESGQKLEPLSPAVNFILNKLHNSAQGLLSNTYNIFKFLSTKTITITN